MLAIGNYTIKDMAKALADVEESLPPKPVKAKKTRHRTRAVPNQRLLQDQIRLIPLTIMLVNQLVDKEPKALRKPNRNPLRRN